MLHTFWVWVHALAQPIKQIKQIVILPRQTGAAAAADRVNPRPDHGSEVVA